MLAALPCGFALHRAFVSVAEPKAKEGAAGNRRAEFKAAETLHDAALQGGHLPGRQPRALTPPKQRPDGLLPFLAALGLGGAAVAKSTHTPRDANGGGSGAAAVADSPPGFAFLGGVLDGVDLAKWLPRVSLMLMALCCSTNFTLVKLLEDGHSEQAVAAVRFCVALLPFLPLVPKYMDWVSFTSGVEIGAWCVLGYVTQALGLPHVEASKGAFLTSLAMVVVPLAKTAFGHRVDARIWAAVALAVAGTALLVGLGDTAVGGGFGTGECFCTMTAIGFGLMFVRMDEYAKHPKFDAMGCTTWQVVTLAVSMAAWSWWTEGTVGSLQEVASILSDGPQTLATLAWVGFVTTAAVLYIETWAMEEVDGTEAGIIFASEPVWATLFASAVLGESFGSREAAGGACILLACLLTQLRWDSKPAEAAGSAP